MEDSLYEERKTPAGFLVKVRLAKMTYVVFTDQGPEVPRGSKNKSIVVSVPNVAFLGSEFNLGHFRLGELSFVNVKGGKLVIPYQHGYSNEIKTIFLSTGSASDILPVVVQHFQNKEELIHNCENSNPFNHLIVDEDIPRTDMVSLKIRFPSMNILVIKKKIVSTPDRISAVAAEKGDKVVDFNAVRATDVISNSNLNQYSQNPVFLARIHLRNMELDKVKQLLFDFKLSTQDVTFIRTFLEVMIKNEFSKDELRVNKDKLIALNEAFRLSVQILGWEVDNFEMEIQKGLGKDIAAMLYTLLSKEQDECRELEKELVLWEWKLRVKKILST
ncbi:hypothetical protein [Leptospira sp. GIMC2001]|uniref:hypothetical protein n=1 Tax=Leptospira sp. GIMC2001 TaxID=1513297 RepID=UPI002349FC11|nr:hypothetical protein [Leptospira sp. GIMC2001]WCL47672.1 hypothetical protein O4O04_01510 [Leptospira sp. GIMC2001]